MLLPLCLGLLLLSACAPHELPLPYAEWLYTDVKMLDDEAVIHTDESSQPDLLALYLRESEQEIQLRLDFFDLAQTPDFDLHLAFDSAAGGAEMASFLDNGFSWDSLVSIAASGQITIQDSKGQPVSQARIQVFRDPFLDHITLSAFRDILPAGPPGFQVFTWITAPGSEQILDFLPLAFSESRPPDPVNLLMAFSNSFPAYTPALALRRWDGAHTGPSGGRHGLYNLLRISTNFQVPVVLLDLANPASLSALDYMGKLEEVSSLVSSQLVITPQYAPTLPHGSDFSPDYQVVSSLFELNQEFVSDFEIRQPQLLYSPSGLIPPGSQARVIFIPASLEKVASLQVLPISWKDKILLPSSRMETIPQATTSGPSLELKHALVSAMLQTPDKPSNLLVLGGSLPASAWGDPQAARPTLRYLASRPWLNFVNEAELLTFKGSTHSGAPISNPSRNYPNDNLGELWQAIQSAPPNELTQAARQAYLAAANPVYPQPPELQPLRQIYLGQIWVLLAAAEWGENPASAATCSLDIEYDGVPDCLYANNYLYAVFDGQNSSITHLFFRENDAGKTSLHQIIGPSAQLISGLSEASTWDMTAGYGADPQVLQGAFDQAEAPYTAQIQSDGIRFINHNQSVKNYYFSENTIRFQFTSPGAPYFSQQSLPLMLDPWRRFEPGWSQAYQLEYNQDTWHLRLAPDLEVKLRSTIPLTGSHFLESQDWMAFTENPNREQPAGHFLPFPLAVFEILTTGNFELTLEIENNSPQVR